MIDVFKTYLQDLAKAYPGGEGTEHSGRSALEALLKAVAVKGDPKLRVQHEPGRQGDKGAPDFRVTKAGQIIGYVENKKIGEKLSAILKTEQIKNYRALSGNLILTNYLDFIWIEVDKVHDSVSLAYSADIESGKIKLRAEDAAAVEKLLTAFLSTPPQGIGRAQKLALALAVRCHLLRDFLGEELVRQEKTHKEGRLYGLFQVFKEQVFHELTMQEFADAFAQTLGYGLFLAKLNAEAEIVTLDNARQFVPDTFRLIRELVQFLDDLKLPEYRDVRWVVEEILSIVNGLDIAGIHEDLAFKNRKAVNRNFKAKDEEEWRLFSRDPFIYFYEDFLAKYDKDMKKARGVYYTPPPIVNFIVRAIDDILKDKFEIAAGLADHKRVTVLDFACGTGTFLLEVFQQIFENIGGPDKAKAPLIVREHLLKNIYGFEYLIAPYSVAHLKLSQYLKEKGHPLHDNERLQVFLTNTLEPIAPEPNFFLPAISDEVKAAQEVKDKAILVITGNPPYSGHSKNNSPYVKATIAAYRRVDGKPLGEKNPKWLQDDYVKFIRFAQMKMDKVEEGVVGIITNHSWLDNPTFRGMRQSLMNSFEQIHVLDLHGNAKKRERAPDGSKDENVFDIEQGVAISLFVKKPGLERGVWHGETWGKRLEKYVKLSEAETTAIEWGRPQVFPPYHLFVPINWDNWEEYNRGISVSDSLNPDEAKTQIFRVNNVGLATGNDDVVIQFTEERIRQIIRDVVDGDSESFKSKYGIKKYSSEWSWKNIHQDVAENAGRVMPIHYRPFDTRFSFYTGQSNGFMSRPRSDLAKHMLNSNVGLVTSRMTKGEDYAHVDVTNLMSEVICLSPTTSNNGFLFPLRIEADQQGMVENFTTSFRDFLDARYDYHYSPEEILGYIYAVLHAPAYRRRYAEFLRIDFPRIPFPETKPDFDALSDLGQTLVEAHLLKKPKPGKLGGYDGKGGNGVEAVRYSAQEQVIWINKTQNFRPVPEEVWNFHIGGYQVLDKYLKSRIGRKLSLDEIDHVAAIANVLSFTIGQMSAIDTAYLAAFPGRG